MSTQDQFEPNAVDLLLTALEVPPQRPTTAQIQHTTLDHIEKILAIQAKVRVRCTWIGFAFGVLAGASAMLLVQILIGIR